MSNHLAYDVNHFSTIMQTMEDEANEVDTVDILQMEYQKIVIV